MFTQREMLKRLRGDEVVLNGRGSTTPFEVGFSVAELERALDVVQLMVKYVSSPRSPPAIKALGWRSDHFGADIRSLKEVIQETKEALAPKPKEPVAARGRPWGRGRSTGGGRARGGVKRKLV